LLGLLVLGSIDESAVSGYNPHPTACYSPCRSRICVIAEMSWEGRDQAGNPSTEQQAPWAKRVRPGRNDDRARRWCGYPGGL